MRHRAVLLVFFRVIIVTGTMVAVYATAPLTAKPQGRVAVQLILGLLALSAVLVWLIRSVLRSPYPRLRAVEAIAVSAPFLVLLFAASYVIMAEYADSSFSESLSRVDAVYFSVTVLTTVGFGDIVAQSEAARMVVTVQMVADLVLIGVVARVLLGAVQRRTQSQVDGVVGKDDGVSGQPRTVPPPGVGNDPVGR